MAGHSFFPSPLVGEGGPERSEGPGEGSCANTTHRPLTRLAPPALATLSHKGRGFRRVRLTGIS